MSDFEWSSGVQYAPEGFYDAEFKGYELLPAKDDMGEAVKWKFVVKGGIHDGKLTGNIGTRKPTDQNVSGRIIRGLLGGSFKPGDKVDVNSCKDKMYKVAVQNNKNDRPVVVQVQVQPK